jgi:hypothetical protein
MDPGLICTLPVAQVKGWRRRPHFRPCGKPASHRVILYQVGRDLCRDHSRQYLEDQPWVDLRTYAPDKLMIVDLVKTTGP